MGKSLKKFEEIFIGRDQLYDLVWSKTLKEIADTYKITQISIKKKCIEYDIPFPENGYWTKIHLGQEVEIPELIGNSETKVLLYYMDKYNNHYIDEPNLESLRLAEIQFQLSDINVKKENLVKPLKIIKELKQNLTVNKNIKNTWTDYRGVVSSSLNNLDTSIGNKSIKRSLIIWNYLIQCLEKLGHSIQVTERGTYVITFDERVKVQLKEKCVEERVKENNSSWERRYLVPNGFLGFRLDDSYRLKEYYESKTTDIFDKIPMIISKIEEKAKKEIEWKKQCELSRIKQEKEKIERENKAVIVKKEKDKVNLLIANAKRYQLINLINQYISGENLDEEYISWARKKVLCIDPNIDHSDTILGDFQSWGINHKV